MKIIQGHHTGLTVESLDRSLHFYVGLLELDLVFRWNPKTEYLGKVTGYRRADFHIAVIRVPNLDYYIELLEYRNIDHSRIDSRHGNPGIAHIAFKVDDLEKWYEHLVSKGVKSVSLPVVPEMGPNRGGKIVYMIDPDGYRVELIQTTSVFDDFNPFD